MHIDSVSWPTTEGRYDIRSAEKPSSIAVNDGVDSEQGDSEGIAAIRNLFNEWYLDYDELQTERKISMSMEDWTKW